MTEYERRGPNDRADIERRAQQRAELSGIPHYVLSTSVDTWIAGEGARNNLWRDLVPVVSYNAAGERVSPALELEGVR